eukprot:12319696-Prorocentrum_lima.AAC.1
MFSVAVHVTWPVEDLAAAVMRCLNIPKKQTSNGCRSHTVRAGIINRRMLYFVAASQWVGCGVR